MCSHKDTPAGSILLSSAIFYSGETATKVLWMLSHMNVACITDRAYYVHWSERIFVASSFSSSEYQVGKTTCTV